jgi:hypothetical protein
LWSAVKGVGSLARLNLGELGDEGVALRLREPGDSSTVSLDPEA